MVLNLASTIDYEALARDSMDMQTFAHLQGGNGEQPADYQGDFNLIKLKLNGMANLAHFEGVGTTILGRKVGSPICVGPLPPLHDANLVLNQQTLETISPIQTVCHEMNQLCVIPHGQAVESGKPHLVHVVPTKNFSAEQVLQELDQGCMGIVLECGYTPKSTRDARNRYPLPSRVVTAEAQKQWEACCFRFDMVSELKKLNPKLAVVVRGIMTVEDALKAAEGGASAVWVTNDGSFFSEAPSPISVLPYITRALKSSHPQVEVFFQGGVRRGTDVLKAVAFGASAVFLDPEFPLWAIHSRGQPQGLTEMLTMLNEELKLCMVLTRCMSIRQVEPDHVIQWVQGKQL